MNHQELLEQPVASLSGIGKQTAKRLQKLNIFKIADLLLHLPLRYQDRTRIRPIASLRAGEQALICGEIALTDLAAGRRQSSLLCRIQDSSGLMSLRFFHFSAKQQMQLQPGILLSCFGEIRQGYAGLEMIHPEYKIVLTPEQCPTDASLTPVYPLTEGLRQTTLRKIIQQALQIGQSDDNRLIDYLPKALLEKYRFPPLIKALSDLHAPDPDMDIQALQNGRLPALRRLVFEEFLAHSLSLQQNRNRLQLWQAPLFKSTPALLQNFKQCLPFTLTGAQHRVIQEVTRDCSNNHPMLRLIQGDVGSGKTVICAYAALLAIHSGYQVAIMAPTELLAEQHYRTIRSWFDQQDIHIALLTAQLKGNPRQILLDELQQGQINILIGTHALFQESVVFNRLGLIIIDEQHRFGVHQRMALREKGRQQKQSPHQLVMTATPIPRTLAMLNYSDLDISIIDELPPGRKPVVTCVIPAQRRQQVIDKINGWIARGQQAYWVCTLIEESEALQCEAVEKTRQTLAESLPDIRIALLHGRMKATEKETVMQAFKQQHIDLLVATTVIEVGVDVANASLMIIENAERLGLSQLHQLRGRVGRGGNNSYCLLLYQSPLSDIARQRLGILRDTCDGFAIAEKDLQLRGPGEVMGTRQTGQIRFKIADLGRDADLLADVQQACKFIQTQTPEVIQPLINRWLGHTSNYAEV